MVTRGKGCKKGIVREFGINMNTLLYFKQTSYKDLLCTAQGTLLSVIVVAWMGGEFGGKLLCLLVSGVQLFTTP